METQSKVIIRENWLTQTGNRAARELTLFYLGLLFLFGAVYLLDVGGVASYMSATPRQLFERKEYWRAFTTIFAHADLGHLLSNSFLFVPFAYFLSRHFGLILFPLLGLTGATLTNVVVLATMPENTSLVGASGLVYWMGAAWLTMFWLLDRRDRAGLRLGKVLMVGGVLFVPDVLRPQVSHMAHYVGLAFGVLSAWLVYALNRRKYEAAEVRELVSIEIPDFEGDWKRQLEEASGNLTPSSGAISNHFTQVTPIEYKRRSNNE